MRRDATDTRERILDAAHAVVMRRGFAATSIDAIQEAAEISRGTFFYHFPSKDDLARELLFRYAEFDRAITEEFMERAGKLASDPLQQVLVFVGLHAEMFEEMGPWEPGCLFASFSYEAGLFDEEAHRVIEESVTHFRTLFGDRLREAMEVHPPRVALDPEEVAELAYGVFQGAFILSRVHDDPSVIVRHTRQLRTWIELLFDGGGS